MGVTTNKIEITIHIIAPSISDVHATISSVLEQSNLASFELFIRFINPENLNIKTERLRLNKSNIHIIDKPSNARFVLSLNAGEVISRSFLYKGYHYLLNNDSVIVSPEYTFRRIENTLIITTIKNDQMLCNQTIANLIDRQKLSERNHISPRVSIIKDTCSALTTIDIDFYEYIYQIKQANPFFDSLLFSPAHSLDNNTPQLFENNVRLKTLKQRIISLIKASMGRSKILKKLFKSSQGNQNSLIHTKASPYISNQMRLELDQLSTITYGLKGYMSMRFVDLTYETFFKSEQLYLMYSQVVHQLTYSNYTYIMILPWIISGGIDLFAINYLQTIAKLHPDQNILVILTNNAHKSFSKEQLNLPDNITLIDLPRILRFDQISQKLLIELVHSLINIIRPQRLHIMASKIGYDCLIEHSNDIRSHNTKILFSSYNYLTGPNGEYMGYSIQELPLAYRPGDIITTDNLASKKLWTDHFGFISKDILVHRQLFDCSQIISPSPTTKDGIAILWAAHIRPEKNPEILLKIAKALQADKITIDCYGLFSSQNWNDEENPLDTNIPNLHYKGPYRNFFKDIDISKYDLFLYTSHADGTPNVVIEAALTGLPIVASKIGGIPDVLGSNAILVNDTYSAEEFIQAIRKTVSNLSNARKKALELQKRLASEHNKNGFINQVKDMLERTNP